MTFQAANMTVSSATLVNWIETHIVGSELLSFIGLAVIVTLVGILALGVLKSIAALLGMIGRRTKTASIRRDDSIGPKILIAPASGGSAKAMNNFLTEAISDNLPNFNFGAPFKLIPINAKLGPMDALRDDDLSDTQSLASSVLRQSEASMLMWATPDRRAKAYNLHFMTLDQIDRETTALFTYTLPNKQKVWDEDAARGIGYIVAKRLQPALGRPRDFRAERLEPIVRNMETLLLSEGGLRGRHRCELEDDFAAGALHLGEETGDLAWLEKASEQRTRALETIEFSEEPFRWISAKIDLGRAQCAICEKRFDPVRMQDAMQHLRDAIDRLKGDDRLQLAETAMDALGKAEQTLANRRRFSIRWTV